MKQLLILLHTVYTLYIHKLKHSSKKNKHKINRHQDIFLVELLTLNDEIEHQFVHSIYTELNLQQLREDGEIYWKSIEDKQYPAVYSTIPLPCGYDGKIFFVLN